MTMTLELGPEEIAALERRAEAEGVDIQTVLHRLIAQIAPPLRERLRRCKSDGGKGKWMTRKSGRSASGNGKRSRLT